MAEGGKDLQMDEPQQGRPQSGSGSLQSGSCSLQSGSGSLQSGSGSLQSSGSGSLQSGSGSLQSGSDSQELERGSGSRQSGSGSLQTGSGSLQSGSGSVQSGPGSVQSGPGCLQTGSGSQPSGSSCQQQFDVIDPQNGRRLDRLIRFAKITKRQYANLTPLIYEYGFAISRLESFSSPREQAIQYPKLLGKHETYNALYQRSGELEYLWRSICIGFLTSELELTERRGQEPVNTDRDLDSLRQWKKFVNELILKISYFRATASINPETIGLSRMAGECLAILKETRNEYDRHIHHLNERRQARCCGSDGMGAEAAAPT